ncbi:hypothetical protein [Pontiella desulfatans]|uniref:hypothetical protein n=1 Tax=Pontiella desulfatans TaxID=2750659 RepID=UPI00109D60CD|nr:hypothetical protein [Pontiella desulfatans]
MKKTTDPCIEIFVANAYNRQPIPATLLLSIASFRSLNDSALGRAIGPLFPNAFAQGLGTVRNGTNQGVDQNPALHTGADGVRMDSFSPKRD